MKRKNQTEIKDVYANAKESIKTASFIYSHPFYPELGHKIKKLFTEILKGKY